FTGVAGERRPSRASLCRRMPGAGGPGEGAGSAGPDRARPLDGETAAPGPPQAARMGAVSDHCGAVVSCLFSAEWVDFSRPVHLAASRRANLQRIAAAPAAFLVLPAGPSGGNVPLDAGDGAHRPQRSQGTRTSLSFDCWVWRSNLLVSVEQAA